MPNTKSGIYKITCIINNKIYIGSSKNITHRKSCHKTKRNNCIISKAIFKYGWENFKFEILELCSEDKLLEREQYYLDFFKSYDKTIGYNVLNVAGINPMLGRNHSEDTKTRLSDMNKGKFTKEKNPFWGKAHSNETKVRMSELKKTSYLGENNPFFGKTHSLETKAKMSIQAKNRDKSHFYKQVNQIDPKTNEIIKTWTSIKEACFYLTNDIKRATSITSACKGRYKTALGFKWEYPQQTS